MLGDNSNNVLYQGQWVQRSEYDRIMAQQAAEQQAAADAATRQQEQQRLAEQQRIAELNPSGATFVKAVPGEQGRPTIIQRYYADSGQYDTISYDKASPEMQMQANQYISSHESEFKNISLEKRTGYTPPSSGYIDVSSVTPEMRVTVPGSGYDDNETRRVLSTLPNWTPVNLGGNSLNMDTFAFNGGIVNSRGEYYTGYGPATAGAMSAPTQEDLSRVNSYINGQNDHNAINKPEKVNMSRLWSDSVDTAPRLTQEQLSVLEKGGTVNVTMKDGDTTQDFIITSSGSSQSKPQGFGENWNAGISEWEKNVSLPFGAPAWLVGDVLRTPGNTASMIGGVTGEMGTLGGVLLTAGPVAAGGKAVGDWWQWEKDLGQSLKADPARYLYNLGVGVVIGKGISKAVNIGGGTASNMAKNMGPVKTYGANMFKGTTTIKPIPKATVTPMGDAGSIADGFALLDDAVLPSRGITIKNPAPVKQLTPAPAGKGVLNQILSGYSREAPESYAPKNYYNRPTSPRMPGDSMVNKILAAYSKEAPESYIAPPSKVRTIDLSRESQRLWEQDIAKTQKSASSAYKADMGREVEIGGVEYKGKLLFADDEAAYGGMRQVLVAPETINVAKNTKNLLKSSMFLGGGLSVSNLSGLSRQRVTSPTINLQVNKTNLFSGPDISGLIGTGSKTKVQSKTGILSMGGSGTPPTNRQVAGQGSGLGTIVGSMVGVGALTYGSRGLLGSHMGIPRDYGSFKKTLGSKAKNQKYMTGDVTGLIYGKKKKKSKRR